MELKRPNFLTRNKPAPGKPIPAMSGNTPDEVLDILVSLIRSQRPLTQDEIKARYESWPLLNAHLRNLEKKGVIVKTKDDPPKYDLTREGFEWAREGLSKLRIEPAQWAAMDARMTKDKWTAGKNGSEVKPPIVPTSPSGVPNRVGTEPIGKVLEFRPKDS